VSPGTLTQAVTTSADPLTGSVLGDAGSLPSLDNVVGALPDIGDAPSFAAQLGPQATVKIPVGSVDASSTVSLGTAESDQG
jgi:hypothetical protein